MHNGQINGLLGLFGRSSITPYQTARTSLKRRRVPGRPRDARDAAQGRSICAPPLRRNLGGAGPTPAARRNAVVRGAPVNESAGSRAAKGPAIPRWRCSRRCAC